MLFTCLDSRIVALVSARENHQTMKFDFVEVVMSYDRLY